MTPTIILSKDSFALGSLTRGTQLKCGCISPGAADALETGHRIPSEHLPEPGSQGHRSTHPANPPWSRLPWFIPAFLPNSPSSSACAPVRGRSTISRHTTSARDSSRLHTTTFPATRNQFVRDQPDHLALRRLKGGSEFKSSVKDLVSSQVRKPE